MSMLETLFGDVNDGEPEVHDVSMHITIINNVQLLSQAFIYL